MKRYITILFISCLTALAGCSRKIEPQVIAGYISEGSQTSVIIIAHPDSLQPMRIALTENTKFTGGALIIGNIAEVVYLPTENGQLQPTAISVTADKTFPQALGRWESRNERSIDIAIELLPYGRIMQSAPSDVLIYTSWHLTDKEDIIELCGTLSLPPERPKKGEKTKAKINADTISPPQRRIRSFRVEAKLGFENNNKVMTITTDKGRRSKLHFIEDDAAAQNE